MSGAEGLERRQEPAGPKLSTGGADAHRDLENLIRFILSPKENQGQRDQLLRPSFQLSRTCRHNGPSVLEETAERASPPSLKAYTGWPTAIRPEVSRGDSDIGQGWSKWVGAALGPCTDHSNTGAAFWVLGLPSGPWEGRSVRESGRSTYKCTPLGMRGPPTERRRST